MSLKARDLVDSAIGVTGLEGNPQLEVTRAGPLDTADKGTLTFAKASAPEADLVRLLSLSEGCAIVCTADLAPRIRDHSGHALLLCDHPRFVFARLVSRHFPPPRPPEGVHPTAVIDASAQVDPSASIGAHCFVGPGCRIGRGSVLHPHVILYRDVRMAGNVTVNSGTVIGADGFGYERNERGELEKFPHLGGVLIEDEVEIGSNTSIDRGSLGDTILRRGCKIDNQIHVAHNCEIGENAVVIAQAMIGGSVVIGAGAWIAPAAVIMNQVRIGEKALAGLGAVVTKNVPAGETVMGSPAAPEAEFKAVRAAIKGLVQRG